MENLVIKCLTVIIISQFHNVYASEFSFKREDFGSIITCYTEVLRDAIMDKAEEYRGKNHSAVLIDEIKAFCENDLIVRIVGLGLGIRYTGWSTISVACTSDIPIGVYHGLKVSAEILVGLQGGVFVGNKGACAVGSLDLGLGASVNGSKLIIENNDNRYNF